MKEATGELNMTVVTVVAIAAVGAFFYAVIWPTVKENLELNTKCANAVCTGTINNGVQTCTYNDGTAAGETIYCSVDS